MSKNLVTIAYLRDTPDAYLDREVAGRPVRAHLAERLARRFGPDVHVVRATDAGTSLNTLVPAGSGVLVVDGRAWFPLNTWREPWRGSSRRTVRLIGEQVAQSSSTQQTLAVYFDGTDLGHGAELLSQTLVDACKDILDGSHAAVRDAPAVLANGLLVDSCYAVARLEASLLQERAIAAMSSGVWLRDPSRVYIRGSLVCGADVTIDVDVIFEGAVVIGDNTRVDAHCIVTNATIGANTWVKPYSLVEDAQVGSSCNVGPYARVRPGSRVGDRCQIGNFVELKNSTIGDESRINHHSFIGDAVLADRVTIGAGTITCNHDGVKTNPTVIERGAYIGSGCKLVAPLRVGEGATIGAGSTITEDVPGATLTLARARQVTIPNWPGPRSLRPSE